MINFKNDTLNKFVYLFLRRLKNRVKPLFRWREIWNWEYESCDRCGCCYKLTYSVLDDTWLELQGSENGTLCIDCMLDKADSAGLEITQKNFDRLFVFQPDRNHYADIVVCMSAEEE